MFKVTEIDLHPYVSILYYMHYYAKNNWKWLEKTGLFWQYISSQEKSLSKFWWLNVFGQNIDDLNKMVKSLHMTL